MKFIIPTVALLAGLALGRLIPGGDRDAERPAQGAGGLPGEPPVEGRPGNRSLEPAPIAPSANGVRARLEEAFREGNGPFASMRPLMSALGALSAANIATFTRFFDQLPLREAQLLQWRLFFSAWGEFDAKGAIAYIDQRFDQPAARRLFYAAVIDTWKDSSVDEVIDFAAATYLSGKGVEGAGLALDYLRELAAGDPAAAAQLAGRLGDGELVLELVSRRVAQLVATDRESALAAIESLEGEAHTHAAGAFMTEWAKGEPAAAAQWLIDHFSPDLGTHAITGVAAEYLRDDPGAAVRWARRLPDGVPQGEVVEGAFLRWAQEDEASALAWLGGAGRDAIYDGALVSAGTLLAGSAPRAVIEEWVPRITDPALADGLLYETSLAWQRDNLRDFTQWLESAPSISAEARRRLMARELPGEPAANPPPSPGAAPPADQGRGD